MKRGAGSGPEKIKQQGACNQKAGTSPQKVTPQKIDKVSRSLNDNNSDSQPPSPETAFEPANRRSRECRAQQ